LELGLNIHSKTIIITDILKFFTEYVFGIFYTYGIARYYLLMYILWIFLNYKKDRSGDRKVVHVKKSAIPAW